jgi:hypothetical protein
VVIVGWICREYVSTIVYVCVWGGGVGRSVQTLFYGILNLSSKFNKNLLMWMALSRTVRSDLAICRVACLIVIFLSCQL